MTWDQFSFRFVEEIGDLQESTQALLQDAIKTGKDVKLKKEADELDVFFSKVQERIVSGVPTDSEGAELEKEIEQSEEHGFSKSKVATKSSATYDDKTGRKEGEVVLQDGKSDGLLVPIVIQESVQSHFDHTGKEVEDRVLSGDFKIKNPSARDRLWDIEATLKNIDSTDIDDAKVTLQELGQGEEKEIKYNLTAKKEKLPSHLDIKEFISTVNDPQTESYALKLGEDQPIYFKITAKNVSDAQLTSVQVNKAINPGFSNLEILGTSGGEAKKEEDSLTWTLQTIEAGAEAALEFRLTAHIEDMSVKVQSGAIKVNYTASSSLSGVGIEKFTALSNNRFFINFEELEQEPDKFNCQLVFQNSSEFYEHLVNADVYDPEDDTKKFVDINPDEVPELPAGAQWASVIWQYTTPEPQTEPQFRKICDFFVMADNKISTMGIISIDEVEMAVASIDEKLAYDVKQLPSYRDTTFHVTHKLINTGAAVLNEAAIREIIPAHFLPPDPKELKLTLSRDGEDSTLSIPGEAITIEPDNQDPETSHTVTMTLKDLIADDETKGFKPDDMFTLYYPITAVRPDATVVYNPDVLYQANTLPAGKPLEIHVFGDAAITIPVMHVRRKYQKGKEIRRGASESTYEIVLFLKNTGQFNLENIKVEDMVPENFEYSDASIEPSVKHVEGEDILTWTVDILEPGQDWTVEFKINGSDEYSPKEAQFSM
ncbi:MAG TPA: hypothetical protein VKM55_11245 [Candidatus Lokiarchaeia archaeon]|nr:hypothetical protein [Candidatus Lokiarchaeia archaeon]